MLELRRASQSAYPDVFTPDAIDALHALARLDLDLIRKAVTVVMDDLDDIRTALLDGALPTV